MGKINSFFVVGTVGVVCLVGLSLVMSGWEVAGTIVLAVFPLLIIYSMVKFSGGNK